MKFIVKPLDVKKGPPMHTMCMLCSENPKACL
jgi:hypothetical protein